MAEPLIKLYTRAWCGWCDEAKAWLDGHGFQYETVDIGVDSNAERELVKLTGQSRVPTAVINGEILADTDTEQLERFFSERGLLAARR